MTLDSRFRNPLLLTALQKLGQRDDWFLVGGVVRDWLLGRDTNDLDLATPADPTAAARRLAEHFAGHWFWLDRERLQSRVLIGEGEDAFSLDFAPYRAPTLQEDLVARDFTVNAMALKLGQPLTLDNLIDPFEGYRDLQHSILSMVSPYAFEDDPLRILRGIRHAVELSMKIDERTLPFMQGSVRDLKEVAVERIRQEFWRILKHERSVCGFDYLQSTGAGNVLMGECFAERAVVAVTQLDRCRAVCELLTGRLAAGRELLCEEVEEGLDRSTLLAWAVTLQALCVELPARLPAEWCCSRKAIRRVSRIALVGAETWQGLERVAARPRSLLLWAASLGTDPFDLFLAMAVSSGQPVEKAVDLLLPYIGLLPVARQDQSLTALVDGHWLSREFNIGPGKQLGKVLELLRLAEIEGRVTSPEEVRVFLTGRLHKND